MAAQIKKIPQLNPATSVSSSDLFVVNQNNATKKATFGLLKQYILDDFTQARDIQLRKGNGYIQWRYAGDSEWINLVSLIELQGPPGGGAVTQVVFTGDGVQKIFNPISGIISSDALKCIVTVGGVSQQPYIAFTVSADNMGTITFDEAPPFNLPVTICTFQ